MHVFLFHFRINSVLSLSCGEASATAMVSYDIRDWRTPAMDANGSGAWSAIWGRPRWRPHKATYLSANMAVSIPLPLATVRQRLNFPELSSDMIIVTKRILLAVALLGATRVSTRGSFAEDYVRHINRADKPAWLQLLQGTTAVLIADPNMNPGHPSRVCTATSEFVSQVRTGRLCAPRTAGERVTIVRIDDPPAGLRKTALIALIRFHTGQPGYVYASDLQPDPPLFVTYNLRPDPELPAAFRAPRMSSEEDDDPHPTIVGNASVRLLRYDALRPFGAEALVRILSGPNRGETGWVSAWYLRTTNGYRISCFCAG